MQFYAECPSRMNLAPPGAETRIQNASQDLGDGVSSLIYFCRRHAAKLRAALLSSCTVKKLNPAERG